MSKFWDKVYSCDHSILYENYLVSYSCSTPYCMSHEFHCKKCGVYVIECSCNYNNGLSGWSKKRNDRFYLKKLKVS